MKISILHLSDLHYDHTKAFDRQIVIDALLNDLKKARESNIEFDLICFSGDLVNAGSNTKNFEEVIEKFVNPVIDAAGISKDKLFICPGNHDINRNEVASYLDNGLRAELTTVDKVNQFIDNALSSPSLSSDAAICRMHNYEKFFKENKFPTNISNNIFFKTHILNIRGIKVGIASFNSAWRATGQEGDKNHLIIGERVVDRAIEDLDSVDIKICVLHHPFDWLNENDALAIESRLYSTFDLICTGHVHRPNPTRTTTTSGTAITSQCGTLYASRKYFNGYQYIEWDEGLRKATFYCRTYHDNPRREFAPAENLCANGIFQLDLPPKVRQADLTQIGLFLRQARPIIRACANEQISFTRAKDTKNTDDIKETFICPPLTFHKKFSDQIGYIAGSDTSDEIQDDAVLKSPENFILMGAAESGRTSLLHHLAVRAAEGSTDIARIPAVVTMRYIAHSESYERALKSYYADIDIPAKHIDEAIRKLPWIVFIDDFNIAIPKHASQLAYIRKHYPEHRLIVVRENGQLHQIEQALGGNPKILDIGYLSRKDIRQLSRVRYKGEKQDSDIEDPGYQLVMKQLTEARLPRTGYMVTLLLWAAEQNKLRDNLNEAVLLENLISFLLGKTHFESALRDQFDPRAQEFLLKEIAVELRKAGDWTESNILLDFVIQYFKERGLLFGARQVLDEFIACRLLVERDGFIAFRYSCYQEYFIALDFLHAPEKLNTLLQSPPKDVLDYTRELDLWSSLARKFFGVDRTLLNILADSGLETSSIEDQKSLELKNSVKNLDLEHISFNGKKIDFKKSRIQEILENDLTKDEIDELLDEADRRRQTTSESRRSHPKNSTNSPVSEPVSSATAHEASGSKVEIDPNTSKDVPKIGSSSFATQRRAINLLTRIIRNSDHEKVENKRALLDTLLQFWSAHTFLLLESFSALIEERVDEITSKTPITSDDLSRIVNIAKIIIPTGDIAVVSNLLASESLRPFLKEIVESPDIHAEGERLFAAIIFAETWDDSGIEMMRNFLKNLKNEVLKRVALNKMLYDYQMQRYRLSSGEKFRELIVEHEISLGSPKQAKGARLRALRDAKTES